MGGEAGVALKFLPWEALYDHDRLFPETGNTEGLGTGMVQVGPC